MLLNKQAVCSANAKPLAQGGVRSRSRPLVSKVVAASQKHDAVEQQQETAGFNRR